jgi:DNA-directed RNA polymerase specialized sigma24 family protein
MRATEVLTEYAEIRRALAAQLEAAQKHMAELVRTTQVFSAYRMPNQTIGDKVAEGLAELDGEVIGIAQTIDALCAARRDALRAIARLESPAHREVLTLRHLAGLTMAQAAERMGLSRPAAYGRYDAALAMLDRLLEKG